MINVLMKFKQQEGQQMHLLWVDKVAFYFQNVESFHLPYDQMVEHESKMCLFSAKNEINIS